MKVISSWLIQNKEWLFSGVGVVILLAFINVFRNLLIVKEAATQKIRYNPKLDLSLEKILIAFLKKIERFLKNMVRTMPNLISHYMTHPFSGIEESEIR